MKRINFIIIVFIIPLSMFAQTWKSSNVIMGDSDITEIKSTITSDGSIVVLGYFNGTIDTPSGDLITNGGKDYYVAKFLSDGTIDWIKKLGSNVNDYVLGGICACSNDNIYVTGGFKNTMFYTDSDSLVSDGSDDIFLIKYDISGNVTWGRNIGSGAKLQRPNALVVDNNSNLLISGFFADSIEFNSANTLYTKNNTSDFFLGKFNSENGDPIWINHYEALEGVSTGRIFDIKTIENQYVISGTITDSCVFDNDTIISINSSIDMYCALIDTAGNVEWIRKIGGPDLDYSYSVSFDDVDNIYIGGYYNSSELFIDESDSDIIHHTENEGDIDIIVAKYDINGNLQWHKTAGGKYEDRLYDIEYYDENINIAGKFTDSIYWGGILLTTEGEADADMLVASIDKEGNYRNANNYSGRNNSNDEARAIFQQGENLFTVMRTNTDLLTLGEDSYISTSGKYFIAMGVIGCNTISIDNTIYTNVPTCYGDSTGSIQIAASGGFEGPWQYSVDNGLNYQSAPLHTELPAGDYQVVVIDKEGCAQTGDMISLSQPDTIVIEVISTSDITADADGSIVVGAQGGTNPYTYTLQPGDLIQGIGTFMFSPGDSGKYVVQVNDQNLCGPVSTDTIEILDMSHVGINDIGGIALRVFPNPATDIVNIEMPLEASAVTMEVLSLTGQIVMSRQAYTTGGVLRETLDVSDLAQGMYMLRVNGQTLKSAIVVQ